MRDVVWIPITVALTTSITAAFGYLRIRTRLRIAQQIRKDHDRESMEAFLKDTAAESRGPGSNRRPTDHESAALPTAPPR